MPEPLSARLRDIRFPGPPSALAVDIASPHSEDGRHCSPPEVRRDVSTKDPRER